MSAGAALMDKWIEQASERGRVLEPTKKDIPIAHESDVASARQAGGQLAEQAGLNTTHCNCERTGFYTE